MYSGGGFLRILRSVGIYCPGKDILHGLLCRSCSPVLIVNLSNLNHINNVDFSLFQVN